MLNKLWTALFVACLHFPFAVVASGFIGPRNGLTFWIMAMTAHWPVRSVTNLSLGRRLTIWTMSMTAGGIAAGLGVILIALLMQSTAEQTLSASGRVTNLFWFVVAIRQAINWAPVLVAWVVSRKLVRRFAMRKQALSPPAATGPGR